MKRIVRPRKVHATTPAELHKLIGSLRQKLCVQSLRLRRYKRDGARKKQNKYFRNDEKWFYRELSRAELQNEKIEIPQDEDIADYWVIIGWLSGVKRTRAI